MKKGNKLNINNPLLIVLLVALLVVGSLIAPTEENVNNEKNDTEISVEENGDNTDEKPKDEDGNVITEQDKPTDEKPTDEKPEQSGTKDTPAVEENTEAGETQNEPFVLPAYTGSAYTVVNKNEPYFEKSEICDVSFEKYGALDSKGRCTKAVASIGRDIMPTEDRGSIGMVKPTGWHTVKYDCVDGKYLYNRCHLIGFQLTGENANERNLITGTRYMNVEGMLPFENMVADYVKETGNHVMYRVTPVFEGNDLLARGVLMEAYSVEDDGEGVCFCVFVHNVQPQIKIDYKSGESELLVKPEEKPEEKTEEKPSVNSEDYVLNTNTKKFHYPSCSSADQIKESNKEDFTGSRDELISRGYDPCKRCNP